MLKYFSSVVHHWVERILDRLLDRYCIRSYSQEGEDMILRRIFENINSGFYIDVGAHHPKRFSNTYYFYKKGWRGINIDAKPGSMSLFNKVRPNDINIEIAISLESKLLEYHMFKESALNTFDENIATARKSNSSYIGSVKMETYKLADLLEKNFDKNTHIDFITIDVEGFDLHVLQSNNWDKFRPKYLLVECANVELYNISESDVYKFICGIGYDVYAKTVKTFIFKDMQINGE